MKRWARAESNHRRPDFQSGALPTELRAHLLKTSRRPAVAGHQSTGNGGARYVESLPATLVPGATEHHPEAGITTYDSIRFFRGVVGTSSE